LDAEISGRLAGFDRIRENSLSRGGWCGLGGRGLGGFLQFLFEAFRGFLGTLAKLAEGPAQAVARFGQLAGSEDQERHHNYDHDMDGLDSEWHMNLLFFLSSDHRPRERFSRMEGIFIIRY
jgi:hypothetical protein